MLDHIYHGLFKKRKDVEAALENLLPETAQVIFAHGIQREEVDPSGGPSEFKVDILVSWTMDRKFWFVVGQALRYYSPEEGGYKQTGFQMQDGILRDPRGTLDAFDDMAKKQGWSRDYTIVFKDMFKRIVRMLDQWEENETHYKVRSESVPDLPPFETPPISLN